MNSTQIDINRYNILIATNTDTQLGDIKII